MAHKKRGPRRKHVPQRTCIACRQVEGKRALIRLVRTEDGVEIDLSGKKSGRGAYLHPVQDCWLAVLEGNRLSSAMRAQISVENRAKLVEFAQTLPELEAADQGSATEDVPADD